MKKIVQSVFTFFLFLTANPLHSQMLTGIWRGYFITDGGDQYKYEVQLNQSKQNSLTGVTYSYLDTRFYGKATFTGNFTKSSKAALVKEIKTVELRMYGGSVACIMKCRLVYSRSGREEFLEGIYTSSYEKTNPFYWVRKGGDCGGGKVFLRKVRTSDFYVEPFLRNKKLITEKPKDEFVKINPVKTPVTKTPPRTQATAKTPAPKKETTSAKTVKKPGPATLEVKKPEEATTAAKPVIVPKIPVVPLTIRDRKNELTKAITLHNNEVQVSIYDNGEIDDDTVSIYLNGALLLANKRLSNKPIVFTLNIDESRPEQFIVMVAENLGRIPPNTSLMIIQDGDKRHQVSITSTEQKNAMVRFLYGKEEP
jgi:hypothetical protein